VIALLTGVAIAGVTELRLWPWAGGIGIGASGREGERHDDEGEERANPTGHGNLREPSRDEGCSELPKLWAAASVF